MQEQPDVLARLSRHVEHFAQQVGGLATEHGGLQDVVFLAPPPSQPVALLGRHAAALRSGGRPTTLNRRLVIAISPSGDDERVVELARRARNAGSPVAAVTNDTRSALAQLATLSVDVAAGLELSALATKSVTGMMLAVLALVDGLPAGRAADEKTTDEKTEDEKTAGENASTGKTSAEKASVESTGDAAPAASRMSDSAHASALARVVGDLLGDRVPVDAAAAHLVHARRIAVVGGGPHHPAALETARMLRETAGLTAEGFSIEDFNSGPIGGFDDATTAVLIAGSGRTAVRSLAARLSDNGAHVTVIGDQDSDELRIPAVGTPGTLGACAECILATVRGQQLAVAAAQALGVDPDRPAGRAARSPSSPGPANWSHHDH
jgi:glucosamine--fructose-6-phosphate aminotransferase (isomerizing)